MRQNLPEIDPATVQLGGGLAEFRVKACGGGGVGPLTPVPHLHLNSGTAKMGPRVGPEKILKIDPKCHLGHFWAKIGQNCLSGRACTFLVESQTTGSEGWTRASRSDKKKYQLLVDFLVVARN